MGELYSVLPLYNSFPRRYPAGALLRQHFKSPSLILPSPVCALHLRKRGVVVLTICTLLCCQASMLRPQTWPLLMVWGWRLSPVHALRDPLLRVICYILSVWKHHIDVLS